MIRSTLKRGLSKLLGKEDTTPRSYPFKYTPGDEPKSAQAAPAAPVQAAPVQAAPTAPVQAAPTPAPEAPATAPVTTISATDDTAGPAFTQEEIQALLDEMVRPALQGDGGDITLIRVEGNDIYVKLVGSCSTCPSSIATMKMGVEALFREEFPNMGQLIQVD